ncbi:hypothetical protein ACEN88_18425 [Massilia sp. CT11-108]|uniref:hypothetical protein n=1 Tax=Massilia sp. CT11-108 TaxID=3393900 RepID=UPI0039A42B72
MSERKRKIEFGDFQTPGNLALNVCQKLFDIGIRPDVIIEPTCGVGAFVCAASEVFGEAQSIHGFEINESYLNVLKQKLQNVVGAERITLQCADFFATDWKAKIAGLSGRKLVIGNFPWVTSSGIGAIGGSNLPEKSNFQGHNGFDAISGKANFDISEWMLLEVLRWFKGQNGDIAMLVKTAVARKVLAHAEKQKDFVKNSFLIKIDAKKHFNAAVDACLLVIQISNVESESSYDYTVYSGLEDGYGRRVGHRFGLTIGDIDLFEKYSYLIGESPQKWRSGVKHDASSIMEFTMTGASLINGLGETVEVESDYLFPLLKGSDVGSDKGWRNKYALVTQRKVGEDTSNIRAVAPKTWEYLQRHGAALDARGSSIYAKNPRFSVFGVGDYTFRPWKVAICALYKSLSFRVIGPIEGRPVVFDDTVYYISFDTEAQAKEALMRIQSNEGLSLLSSLIFWDEKRPIKTSILNIFDWSRIFNEKGESNLFDWRHQECIS